MTERIKSSRIKTSIQEHKKALHEEHVIANWSLETMSATVRCWHFSDKKIDVHFEKRTKHTVLGKTSGFCLMCMFDIYMCVCIGVDKILETPIN
jgi:hypothetical protein